MPLIDTSLLPEDTEFIIRLAPVGGWPNSPEGYFVPATAHITQALDSRFGQSFDVTKVDTQQQYADYHIARQDRPLSGYHIAKAISNDLENSLFARSSEMPDIDVTVLPADHSSELIGFSHARNQRRR